MNLPKDFEIQMNKLLGNEYGFFRESYEKPYYSALRRNTRKIAEKELASVLGVDFDEYEASKIQWESNGVYYSIQDSEEASLKLSQPGKSPLHDAGLYYIQEPSAMLPVSLLNVDDSGMRVLDLCAAPGGKTTQIADRMNGKGILIANEIMPARAKILSENIERMGVSNAIIISADPKDIVDRFESFFDRILVDAPCSGEGMFRKHPEAMDEWSLENVTVCANRQSWILDCAADMLKAGGRIVYSTCTFNELEDEGSIKDFLVRHPEFKMESDHRLFPHKDRGEGHFAAVLIKEKSDEKKDKRKYEKSLSKDKYAPFFDFADKALSPAGKSRLLESMDGKKLLGTVLMFGDQLYLAPENTPSLNGLKVLRPGLHLGTIIKNRFEPSHSLALYLNKEDVKYISDYELTDEIFKYLKGEALNNVDGNGWILVTVMGYSIGWGKVSNGIMKNHYPKGLRWQ